MCHTFGTHLASLAGMMLLRACFAAAALAASLLGLPSQVDAPSASVPLRAMPAASAPAARPASAPPVDADTKAAQEILAGLANRFHYLDGVTVRVDETPNGEEAVAYYTLGDIVIDRDHTVTTQKILAHEVWHVIDWRDNGKIDWGEDLPPSNSADYVRH